MGTYREHVLDGASAVDLVVALYDGMIRFLYTAAAAAEKGDAIERRVAVKRALDIIIHLQARLRMDIGGRPAQALSEFYASIFAQILQASQAASRAKFEHAIDCVRNVRDAWREVARDPHVTPPEGPHVDKLPACVPAEMDPVGSGTGKVAISSWTA
jgi:flagellar secretion chaperone FliS